MYVEIFPPVIRDRDVKTCKLRHPLMSVRPTTSIGVPAEARYITGDEKKPTEYVVLKLQIPKRNAGRGEVFYTFLLPWSLLPKYIKLSTIMAVNGKNQMLRCFCSKYKNIYTTKWYTYLGLRTTTIICFGVFLPFPVGQSQLPLLHFVPWTNATLFPLLLRDVMTVEKTAITSQRTVRKHWCRLAVLSFSPVALMVQLDRSSHPK